VLVVCIAKQEPLFILLLLCMKYLTSFCLLQLKTAIPRFIPPVEAGPYVRGLIPLPLGILLIKHRVLHHTINLIYQPFDLEVLEEH